MTRRKQPSTSNDRYRYKQTDISAYFKVKNKVVTTAMNTEQSSTNKENDSEELILSPRKKPKPISDDETESINTETILNALVAPLKTTKSEMPSIPVKKPVLREHQPPQRSSVQLPLALPVYTYSEDSDSDVLSDSKITSTLKNNKKTHHRKAQIKENSQPILSASSNKKNITIAPDIKKNVTILPEIKKNLKIKAVVVSSDDEDFEITPRKIRKVDESLHNGRKLTQSETNKKIVDYLASSEVGRSKSRKKLYQSDTNKSVNIQENKNLDDTRTPSVLAVPVEGSSTSKTTPEELPRLSIGVHKPTVVPTTRAKPKPRILQEKSKSDSSLPSANVEFISTDFTSETTVGVLSTSIQSISSNDTIIYEQNINFTMRENISSTPKKTLNILENIIISSPKNTLEQCNLSPITSNSKTISAIKQNASTSLSTTTQDTTIKNSNLHTIAETENGNLTTRSFTKIVKYIGSHDHLRTMLTGAESKILERFFSMQRAEYQLFCFKLFTRIQKWYNIFKLKNELHMELSDSEVREMYNCLYENGFVEVDFSKEPCIDLLNILLKKHLKDICEDFKMKVTNEGKSELIQKLLNNCNRQTTLTFTKSTEKILRDRIKHKMGYCVKLSPDLRNIFNKVHLLYSFTTSDFDKPSDLHFFLSKILNGEIYMPKFNVNMNVRIFSSIPEFSRFAEACECKRAVLECFEKKEIGHMLELCELAHTELQAIFECYELPRSSYMMRFTAGYKYTKALSLGSKHLAQHYPARVEEWLIFLIEQDQYCLQMRGCWYDLLIMVQNRYLKEYETAANTLIEALDRKDISKVHLYELSYRADAIKRNKACKTSELLRNKICFVQPPPLREFPLIEIDARAIRDETGRKGKRMYMEKTEGEKRLLTVEEIALKHYFKNGYPNGLHCEGSLLETIFFVLFWDIIYESPVPDAFVLEMQYFPLDLWHKEFYLNRKEAIDKRLVEIRSNWPYDQLKKFICHIWKEHAHEKSYINDRLIDEPKQLYDIILCIGRVKLTQMLERIVKDFKAYHSGLPDLFLWSVTHKKCKFVEVKGEKDKLSTKQKLWLDFLLSVGADAEVCHVHTIGCNTGRKVGKLKREVKKEEKKCLNKSAKK